MALPFPELRLISAGEAGRRLGRSAKSVKRLVDRGVLRAVRIPGCHLRIPSEDVKVWLDGLNSPDRVHP